MQKSCRNLHQKLVPDPFLILVNNPKKAIECYNFFKKIRYFERRLLKSLKKVDFIFCFEHSSF